MKLKIPKIPKVEMFGIDIVKNFLLFFLFFVIFILLLVVLVAPTIKKFKGTSKNAVMSQILVAMCTYLILAYFRWSNGITRSVLGMVQLMQLCWFEPRKIS